MSATINRRRKPNGTPYSIPLPSPSPFDAGIPFSGSIPVIDSSPSTIVPKPQKPRDINTTSETYVYVCDECGHIFKEKEAYHSIRTIYDAEGYKLETEHPAAACSECYSTNTKCNVVKSGRAPHNAQ